MDINTSHESYDPAFFKILFEVEDKHFWFRSRNRTIASFVKRLASELTPGFSVLEIGCGTGNVLRFLERNAPHGQVFGMDLFLDGLKYAQRRTTAPLVQGDMHKPPFAKRFEIIGLFDVLEHLPDDLQVLSDLKLMLKQGGYLILTVPAYPALWSYFDVASHHCRRYQPVELKQKLLDTGFSVDYISPYMMSIFPLVLVGRYLSSMRQKLLKQHNLSNEELASQELYPIPFINELISLILDLEGCWLARGNRLPFGTSLVAVARRCA